MTFKAKCLRLAEKFERDARAMAEDGNIDGALEAVENHAQLLAIAICRDETTCELVYTEILTRIPQLIPS